MTPTDKQYRRAARKHWGNDDIDVDPNATVSRSEDPGAWVQAWVWVYDTDAELEATE